VSATVTLTLTLRMPLERSDLPGLLLRTRRLLHSGGFEVLCCDLQGVTGDAVTVDALARVALAARRAGCELRLSGVSPQLSLLLGLMGLAEVLGG
jgi:ABC-type transporter Mla MlaB component